MTNININNVITIYKGTNINVPIFINIGSKVSPDNYTLKENDKIYVSIMQPNQPFEYGTIRKIIDYTSVNEEGLAVLKLLPTDTQYVLSGTYYIQMKINLYNGNVATILPKTKFIIQD